MRRETITPASEADWLGLRTRDLTSTDVAALFGLSPYKTAFELWHEKKAGERGAFTENDRMKWGRRLEATVAAGIAEDMGWSIRPMKEYMRLPDVRVGASFDFRICTNMLDVRDDGELGDSAGDAHLEIKCVDSFAFRNGWTIDQGLIEAPPHIELQVQHQMLVSGLRRAYIGAMVGGNDIRIIERAADDAVHAGILAAAAKFWQSIDANEPPPPVMPDDADAVIRMHQFAEPGKLLDAREDETIKRLVSEYHLLGQAKADAEEQQKVRKAELLERIGTAEKVLLDGFSVSAGLVGPTLGTLVTPDMVGQYVGARSGYRLFRVTTKRPK